MTDGCFSSSTDFYEIMDMLDKRLNDKGKNWRHVLKALKVLDYVLHEGAELVVTWAKQNIYIIKTLREFQYEDEEGRDEGMSSSGLRRNCPALGTFLLRREVTLIMSMLSGSIPGGGRKSIGSK